MKIIQIVRDIIRILVESCASGPIFYLLDSVILDREKHKLYVNKTIINYSYINTCTTAPWPLPCCDTALTGLAVVFFVSVVSCSRTSFTRDSYWPSSSRDRGKSREILGNTPSPSRLTVSGSKCATWIWKLLWNFSGMPGKNFISRVCWLSASMKPCR